MTTLQRIKDKRLTVAQERENRVVFELVAESSKVMTVKQLKRCLRAMGFNVLKGEAQALVYEFDYTDSNTIDLADFQKICLAKTLESSDRDKFEQAFRLSMASDASDKVSLRQLALSLHATELNDVENDESNLPHAEEFDSSVLRHQMTLQYYTEEDSDAVQEFLHNEIDLRVSKAALAAFIRV
ncbi:hypothetical protein V7S43_015956 [Phytophthora oleae]|uniref:EF-hand domain-containing protein n=1 Tax=Phytophthora oleae TaxID=2107226 RepID=A0ABD3EX11_9STRA